MFRLSCNIAIAAVLISNLAAAAFPGLPGKSADPQKNAEKAEAFFEKGHVALDNKNPRLAEIAYRKAVALMPHDGRYHRQLALLLSRTGRGQEAEREVRIAMHLDPTDWKSSLLLGHILHAERRYDEEIGTYEQTLKTLPPEEKALKDKLLSFIKQDELAQKQAAEERRKKKEKEEEPFKNAY